MSPKRLAITNKIFTSKEKTNLYYYQILYSRQYSVIIKVNYYT